VKRLYWRLCGGLLVLGLVAWLVFDSSPRDRRIQQVNRALKNHVLGKLSAAQKKHLESTASEMIQALGIAVRVAVDEPYQTGRLNIYTTSPYAMSTTHCGAGNALYDPMLDAIFIDEQFFADEGYRNIYEASGYGAVVSFKDDLVFPDIFVRFIILHELGHRQLHRNIQLYRPHVSGAPPNLVRRYETEADRFAVQGMQRFYSFDKAHHGGIVGEPLRDAVGISEFFDHDIGPANQVYIDLIGTLFMMADYNLYLGTPYSPFFEDSNHPTFLDRAKGAIDAVLENDIHPKLAANFQFLKESLNREAGVGTRRFTEIIVPAPVQDASFGVGELLISGVGNSQLFSVNEDEFTKKQRSDGNHLVHAVPKGAPSPAGANRKNLGFWTLPDRRALLVDDDGDAWEYVGDRRTHSNLDLPKPLTTRGCFHLVSPPQPTDVALASACDSKFVDWFISFNRFQRTASRSHPEIFQELTARLGRPVDGMTVVALDESGVYLALAGPDKNPTLIGSARLSLSSLRVEEATLFKLDPVLQRDNGSDLVWPLLIARVAAREHSFVLRSRDVGGPALTAWELFPNDLPRAVSDASLLVSKVGQVTPDLIADFDPYVVKTWMLTATLSLVYLANDSLYLFDSTTKRFEIVFHPTFEGIQVRLGQQGRWALFMPGGSRVFVFGSQS